MPGCIGTLVLPTVQISDGGLYSVVISISLDLYASITIDGVPGYTYGIEYSTDLTDTNAWTFLANVTLVEPVEIWVGTTVDTHAPGVMRRYYRVVAH